MQAALECIIILTMKIKSIAADIRVRGLPAADGNVRTGTVTKQLIQKSREVV